MLRRHPSSTLFPYTTLFRSIAQVATFAPHRLEQPSPKFVRVVARGRERRARQRGVRADRRNDEVKDRKSTRLNSSHVAISYAVFCLKKKRRGNGHTTEPGRR